MDERFWQQDPFAAIAHARAESVREVRVDGKAVAP